MVSRFSFSRRCSIRSMYYMLFLISLCVALRVWMLDVNLDFKNRMRSALSSVNFFSPRFIPDADTKYVLSWDHQYLISNVSGSIFPSLNCPEKNCVFTGDRDMLNNITDFHAIVFGDKSLNTNERPEERSPSQIFVFMSTESSYRYPACELYNDNYFNWTFTYRLDSDVLWRYFVVRNSSGDIVAPAAGVTWTEDVYNPIKAEIKSILQSKNKSVAWLMNDCSVESFDYMLRLEKHLDYFDLNVDKYRECSKLSWKCNNILTQNYQFILAFENSFAEDYVSQIVLDGYRNYAVPIVYGGANYSRFLPPGSYIDARGQHPYILAHTIFEASSNRSVFESYFKWTNTYSIEEWGTKTHSSLCGLCAALHEDRANPKRADTAPAKKYFRVWWNSQNNMHRCLPANEYRSIEEKYRVNNSYNYPIQ